MSIEKILKDLNQSVQDLNASVQALSARLADSPVMPVNEPVTTLEQVEQQMQQAPDATLGKEGVETYIGEQVISLPEMGAYLAEVANKFGTPAQEFIKNTILSTGGTQALSQVDSAVFPLIKEKVAAWVSAAEQQG